MTDRKVLIFAGTTEGRKLAEVLAENGVACVVCVATEYGAQVMREAESHMAARYGEWIDLRQGRLDADEMRALMQDEAFPVVVDATHPFAVEVSENIRLSAKRCGVLYLRLKRDTGMGGKSLGKGRGIEEIHYFADSSSCAEFLSRTQGNVLLTTGSKELAMFCAEEGLQERLYVRVLPGLESIRLCDQAGIPGSRILALQGPFSTELNYALLKQYQISWMVTKESGPAGGYAEKIEAAQKAGIPVCVIGNPEKGEGLSFAQTVERLRDILGVLLPLRRKPEIALIGMGMGSREGLTVEAWQTCREAEYIFGAQRLLEIAKEIGPQRRAETAYYPYYLSEDILPCLDELLEQAYEDPGRPLHIAILFSGDSGFYSGCEKLYQDLQKWQEQNPSRIRVYPGISSVSYLAAMTGMSWQDAGIVSSHGKGTKDQWAAQLLRTVREHEKTFVLTSGVEDVRIIGELMQQETDDRAASGSAPRISIVTGESMSYPEQEVRERTPRECMELTEKGIYTCLILNRGLSKEIGKEKCPGAGEEMPYRTITHGLPDSAFLREEKITIPMTKEEVREVAISKLHLTPNAVVYDIGSGTGSVSVEIARLDPGLTVYALERKEEAVELTRRNAEKFGLGNLKVIRTLAPEGMDVLPAPTHAFIGGSDGHMKEILDKLRSQNPAVRVVVTAVCLETLTELMKLLECPEYTNVEIVNLQASRARQLGRYHLMQAENPIYIVAFDGKEPE